MINKDKIRESIASIPICKEGQKAVTKLVEEIIGDTLVQPRFYKIGSVFRHVNGGIWRIVRTFHPTYNSCVLVNLSRVCDFCRAYGAKPVAVNNIQRITQEEASGMMDSRAQNFIHVEEEK